MRHRWILAAALALSCSSPAAAEVAFFGFPLQMGHPNINPTYTDGGVTVVCSRDPSTAPYDNVSNPYGLAQVIGGHSVDEPAHPLAGSLRLSNDAVGGPPSGISAAWITFTPDVYQIELLAWDITPGVNRFRIEAYDAGGALLGTMTPVAIGVLPTPAYESLSIRGDTPIRRLRLVGVSNNVMMDAMTVWTESVTPVRAATWGQVKAGYRK